MSKGIRAIQAGIVIFVLVVLVGLWGFVGVDPGVEKVVINKGELQTSYDEGWYWVNPLTTDIRKVSVRPQIYTQSQNVEEGERGGDDSIESKTIDGNVVYVDVAIRYRVVDSERYYRLWWEKGEWPFGKFEDEKIRSPSRDLVRDIVGTITSETVYTGDAQQQIEERLRERMDEELADSGAEVIGVDVRNIRFTSDYQDQLEEKARAKQEYEIQDEQARAEANAEIVRAEADRNASIIRAEGNREADEIRREALTEEVITIRQIEAYEEADTVYVPVGQDGLPVYVDATRNSSDNETESPLTG